MTAFRGSKILTVLAIESSCDETAACVLRLRDSGEAEILASRVASQDEVHRPHGGVVPELASRQHLKILTPLVQETLAASGLAASALEGVVATARPGLLGSLLVGLSFAKAFAWTLNKPFIGVSHLEGHLNAPYLETPGISYPHIGLLVSGGHTALYHCRAFGDDALIGATRDDAAGEAFDKVAKMLKLAYPGGPVIDQLAKSGDPKYHQFPRGQVKGRPLDFSFSGLKTAVRYYLERRGGSLCPPDQLEQLAPTESELHNICAAFQEAVVDSLIEKTLAAAKQFGDKTVLLTGGVACNSRLREKITEVAQDQGLSCIVSSPQYCTDNAAMIAYVGARRLARGESSPWDLNAYPTEIMKGPQDS